MWPCERMSVIATVAIVLHDKQINYKNAIFKMSLANMPLHTETGKFTIWTQIFFDMHETNTKRHAWFSTRYTACHTWACIHTPRHPHVYHTYTHKFWFNSKMCYSNDWTLILWCPGFHFYFSFSRLMPLMTFFYGRLFGSEYFLFVCCYCNCCCSAFFNK